jgi:hypothetical protein
MEFSPLVYWFTIIFPTHIAIWGSKNPMEHPFPRHHRQQQEVDQAQVPATALDALEGILGAATSTSKKVAESTGDQWIEMVVPPFENAFSW